MEILNQNIIVNAICMQVIEYFKDGDAVQCLYIYK
jgi:hypothetical protein